MATKRCSRCGLDKDESEFNRKTRGRLQPSCRQCNSEYLKQHYREKAARQKRKTVRANQERIWTDLAGHPCVDCRETDPVVLQFDHVRGVRCANCHFRKTAKERNWCAYLEGDPVGGRPMAGHRPLVPRISVRPAAPEPSDRTPSMTRPLACVVLAAGEGKRMRSTRPKPLHLLCGRAMLLHILDAVSDVGADRAVVVVGTGAERVTKKLVDDGPPGLPIDFVEQPVQLGTGDAVMVALTAFPGDDLDEEEGGDILVVPGDHPLLRSTTLEGLVEVHRATGAAATVLTARVPDPTGYGRIVRGKADGVSRIVEQRDADAEVALIDEINTSIYCFTRSLLAPALRRVTPDNAQGEYYLTDVIEVLATAGHHVAAMEVEDLAEAAGVNDRAQLAEAEAELRRRTNERWMARGVTMVDPETTYVDLSVRLGVDVTLFPGVILQGATTIGEHTEIGPGSRLVDCNVGADCVLTHTVAFEAEIGDGATVGPFASLPPGSVIAPGTTTGAFYTADGSGRQGD